METQGKPLSPLGERLMIAGLFFNGGASLVNAYAQEHAGVVVWGVVTACGAVIVLFSGLALFLIRRRLVRS